MAALDGWLVFEDEAGSSMTPPVARTGSRRGHTPVVRLRGRSRRRLSVAALACYKAGEPSRLTYRPCPDARPDGRKSFPWKDYRDLIQNTHQQLGGPIVLVWGILNTHLTAGMRRCIADRDWLTVYQLPYYAPDLNPNAARSSMCGPTRCRSRMPCTSGSSDSTVTASTKPLVLTVAGRATCCE